MGKGRGVGDSRPPTLHRVPCGQGKCGCSLGFGGLEAVKGSQVPVSPPITPEGPKRTGPGAAVVHSPPKALEVLRPAAGSEGAGGQRGHRLTPPSPVFALPSAHTQGSPSFRAGCRLGQWIGYLFIRFHVPTCNNSGTSR